MLKVVNFPDLFNLQNFSSAPIKCEELEGTLCEVQSCLLKIFTSLAG